MGHTTREQLAVEFERLTKRYGEHTVVDDLSFTVEPGCVTGFLGPNGSGKSTTMKILLGLASADSGSATIGGHRYRELPDPAGTVGAVLEPDAFHPGRSGRNHLRTLADVGGVEPDRIDEVLALVGLDPGDADRRVGTSSQGMKQRLSLAAALLRDPSVLILDEPGNGLDPRGIRNLRDLLRSRAAAGQTVLVSSHLLAEVEHLVDSVVVIDGGCFVASGALSELRQAATLVHVDMPDELALVLERSGASVQQQDGRLVVRGVSMAQIGDLAFRAGLAVHELSAHSGSLEDLFLGWTERQSVTATSVVAQDSLATT